MIPLTSIAGFSRPRPWNAAEKFILDPRVDELFFWHPRETSQFGRFMEVERPGRLQHTWVSPNTLGKEATVTVTIQNQGERTLVALVHSDLPDHWKTSFKT